MSAGGAGRCHCKATISFHGLWQLGEMPEDWRKANVTSIFKHDNKEDPGNNKPVSLTLNSGKMMEQLILGTISRYMKYKR